MQNGTRSIEFRHQLLCFESKRVAGALNHGTTGCGATAHEDRYADDALMADQGNLCGCAVFQYIEQRHNGGGWEVYVAAHSARLIHDLAKLHFDEFELWVASVPAGLAGKRQVSDLYLSSQWYSQRSESIHAERARSRHRSPRMRPLPTPMSYSVHNQTLKRALTLGSVCRCDVGGMRQTVFGERRRG
jgi:hypothetical protein